MEEVNERLIERVWNGAGVDWAFAPSVGRSGGLLAVWNSSVFKKVSVL